MFNIDRNIYCLFFARYISRETRGFCGKTRKGGRHGMRQLDHWIIGSDQITELPRLKDPQDAASSSRPNPWFLFAALAIDLFDLGLRCMARPFWALTRPSGGLRIDAQKKWRHGKGQFGGLGKHIPSFSHCNGNDWEWPTPSFQGNSTTQNPWRPRGSCN